MRTLFLDRVDSTNSYLKKTITAHTTPYLAILACEQTRGKGRLDRSWVSSPGSSLTVSLLLPEVSLPFQMGLLAARALCLLLIDDYQLPAQIKWPNDILLAGKKISGILCEKIHAFTILGVGVNLNQPHFPDELTNIATSLYMHSGKTIAPKDFYHCWLTRLEATLALHQKSPKTFIQSEILPYLAWLGKLVLVDFQGLRPNLQGRLKGLSPEGFLIVETAQDEIHTITTGDLKLWLQPSI